MNKSKNTIIIVLLIAMIIANIFRFISEYNTPMSYGSIWLSIGMATLSIIMYLLRTEKFQWMKRNSLDPIFITCVSVYIVHFFEYISLMIGNQDTIPYFYMFDKTMVNSSVIVSSTALISIVLGALCMQKNVYMHKDVKEGVDIGRKIEFLQFILLVLFFIAADKRYFYGGYGSVDLATNAFLLQQLIQACLFAIIANKLILLNCNKISDFFKSFSYLFYVTNGIYLLLVILSGDRGPIIYMITPYLFSYFIIRKKRFSYAKFAIAGFVAIILMNFLGAVRSLGEGVIDSKKVEEGMNRTQERLDGGVFFGSFGELSRSLNAYNILYQASENENVGKVNGIGLIDQSIGIVPGLRFFIYPYLGINAKEFGTAYISTKLLGEDHGMGTTCVGDVYYNVGFIGTIILFVIFGYGVRWLHLKLYSRQTHFFFLILGIGYVSYAVYIGRGSFFSPFNVCGYAWMIYLTLSMISKKEIIRRKRRI